MRKGYREIAAGIVIMTMIFSGLFAGHAAAKNGDENGHGLAAGITFKKYEISYNKFPSNTVEYIVIHDTGNTNEGADALSHYEYFSRADRDASAHYFVDDHSVIQIIDDSEGSWHSGVRYKSYATPISNTNSIGIEMCINSDGDYDKAFKNTVDLAAYLMWKYDLPLDHLVRHYDANGKICPLSMSDNDWALWEEFKAEVRDKLETYDVHNEGSDLDVSAHPEWYNNPIMGESTMSAETMVDFLCSRNDEISEEHALRVANAYLTFGEMYGIRGDIAFFQAILETGYLRHGGDVDDSYMNFCGLFNHDSSDYARFDSVEEGVEAHIQHLYAYASTDFLPEGRELLDPRFGLIQRGCRTSWEGLGGRWAVPGYDPDVYDSLEEARSMHRSYGDIIIGLYASAGGLDVRTSVQPGSYDSSNYWDHPIYQGSAAGTRKMLQTGMTGEDVSELQDYLRAIGYDVPSSGYFGSITEEIVISVQKKAGLHADGIVGEDTWGYIINTYVDTMLGNDTWTPPVQTASAQTFSFKLEDRETVDFGSEGDDVLALQQLLNQLGYDLAEDGDFGYDTFEAVISFQEDHALEADGIVGEMTWQALYAASSGDRQVSQSTQTTTQKTNTSSKDREDYPTVSYGDEGTYITELQELLNTYGAGLETDGIFGAATEQAVRSFQSTHGLEVDGIVGPMTWGTL
ncbi:MAG: peptidoglycan-binding protein [Firmicutes bacterium]|nr:peptidoglycan-binding protein [Bacillota bacterium]